MPGTFQGSSHPEHNSTPTAVADITPPLGKSVGNADAKLDRGAIFDQWVATKGKVPAAVPVWWSRRQWIATVCRWATTEEGAAALKSQNISFEMFCAVVTALAKYASGRTGRNVAVTKERIAQDVKKAIGKGSARTVTKIRNKVLAAYGWAMEAHRGEGQPGGIYNRPSIWHLLSRAVGTLSQSVNSHETKAPVSTNSPSAARTRRRKSSPATTPAATAAQSPNKPQDPHARNLAGHLAGRCLGFGRIHPGRLADALQASHLKLRAWSAQELLSALDEQAAKSHFAWPDRVVNPAGFLAHRLRALPERPRVQDPTPLPPRFMRHARRPKATPSVVAATKEALRQSLISSRKAAAA